MFLIFPRNLLFCLSAWVGFATLIISCSDKQSAENFTEEDKYIHEISEQLRIDYTNIQATRESLQAIINDLDAIERFSNINLQLELSVTGQGNAPPDSSTKEIVATNLEEPLPIPSESLIKENIAKYIGTFDMSYSQYFVPPQSSVSVVIKHDSIHSVILKSVMIAPTIKKILYNDGQEEEAGIEKSESYYRGISFDLPNAKAADSLLIKIDFEYPNSYTEINLDANTGSAVFEEYKIIFEQPAKDKVNIKYPAGIGDRLVSVEGLHSSGKVLDVESESSMSVPEKRTLKYLDEVNRTYKKALKKISGSKLNSVEEVKKYIDSDLPINHREIEYFTTKRYEFNGPVSSLRIVAASRERQKKEKDFLIKNTEENFLGYYVATKIVEGLQDNQPNVLFGLINNQGEWKIEPGYGKELIYNGYNFFQEGYKGQSYWLDVEKNELIPVEYFPAHSINDNDDFIKVISSSDAVGRNKAGVFDIKNQKLIVPTENYDYMYRNNIIIAEKTHDTETYYSAYDIGGNKIISDQSSLIEVKGSYLYGDGIFNLKGEKLTQDGWRAVGMFSEDDLQVIEKCASTKIDGYSYGKCSYGVIDEKGQAPFKTDQYATIQPFAKGIAAVQNKEGLWGYINSKGEITIPFQFRETGTFYYKYTLATLKTGDQALINPKGEVFKNFKDSVIRTSHSFGEASIYILKNGKKYNDNGELVK